MDESGVPRSPATPCWANYRTMAWKRVGPDRGVFRATLCQRLIHALALLGGLAVLGLSAFAAHVARGIGFGWVCIACGGAAGVGFTFLGAKWLLGWGQEGRVRFDRRRSRLWTRCPSFGAAAATHGISLESIKAIQVCPHVVSILEASRTASCELNFVLQDSDDAKPRRITMASHTKLDALRGDAEALADFLGVPLLDYCR